MSISPLLIISFVVFSVVGLPSCFSADQQYEECRLPPRCGSGPAAFPNITYPFWGNNIGKPSFCGQTEFELSCKENQTLTLEIENITLRVISAYLNDKTITVADESLSDGGCPKILNFNGDNQSFTLNPTTETIALFNCSFSDPPVQSLSTISCQESNNNMTTYHVFGGSSSNPPQDCTKVGEIPMLRSAKNALNSSNDSDQALKMALEKGFELRYKIQEQICQVCTSSSGICGSESGLGNFRCLCADKPHSSSCNDGVLGDHNSRSRIGIWIALGVLGTIVLTGCLFFWYFSWRTKTPFCFNICFIYNSR